MHAAMYVILPFHAHIHVIVINSKDSSHNFTDPRSTCPLFRGIGLSSRTQLSMAPRVAFGLMIPLVLECSSLAMHPSIRSCQVASCAYMCSFFLQWPVRGPWDRFPFVALRLSTRRIAPCFIARNALSIHAPPNTCSAPLRSPRRIVS